MILMTLRRRFHDETAAGALGDASSGVLARVSYVGRYYDAAERPTATVNVGTNGGSAWTRPGSVPSRSDTVLVSSQTYDAAGWVYETTDPRGLVNRSTYDRLGRTKQTIEAYTDGTVSDTDDKTVNYTYDGSNHVLSLSVSLTGGGAQTTGYVYGVTTANGSTFASNDVLYATQYPDASTGAASSGQQDVYTYNRAGCERSCQTGSSALLVQGPYNTSHGPLRFLGAVVEP
jgi:hypothetical protein